jgi:2-methylcitrate dehydratase PrpD
MTSGHPSRELATALAAARFDDLDSVTVEHSERAVLDWLGSVLAGSLEPPAMMAHQIARGFGESSDATMFGGGRASAAVAAFANGVSAHILELDDIHKTSTVHGGAPIISAALAVAEREHATGEEFLTAVAVGYEAAFRIGEAVNPSHYRFWHPTGTVATFGAAAAAGSILRLTGEQMLHAFGSAGTQAAGLWEFNTDGAMSKHLHPGKAAMNGVMAADLARAGFTGATRILGGERGFFRAMCEVADLARITAGLPTIGKIRENGYKLHACCGHTHSAIDLALALRGRAALADGDAAAQVESLEIETYGPGYDIVRAAQPRTPYQAKFSLAYCVAVALQEGRAGLEQFSGDRFGVTGVQAAGLAALLSRTRVRVAPDLTKKYPAAWPARVTLTLRDGSQLQETGDYPRGTPENPIDWRALENKFESLVGGRFGAEFAARSLGAVSHLATRANMSETFGALAGVTSPEVAV